MPEQRNLILAIVLSVTIILAFQYFYELPRVKESQRQQAQRTEQTTPATSAEHAPGATVTPAPQGAVTSGRRDRAGRSDAHRDSRRARRGSRSRTTACTARST